MDSILEASEQTWGGGGGWAVDDSGNGDYFLPRKKKKERNNRDKPCQFIVTDKINLAGRNKGVHTWMGL